VKDRTVAGLFAGSLVTFILLFGPLIVYLPILMDQAFGVSPLVIGVVVASTSLTTALTSTQIGTLTSRFSEKTLVRASFVLYAAALAVVAFVPYWWLLFVPTVIFGVAQSLNLPNVFSLLNEAAPDENRGAFLALNSTILRLGQTLGPVLMAVIAAPLGLAGAYLAAGALAVAMFVLALALIR
jgi:MFS transporter, ACDE family, multidrug resistance protein